jgi:hypothetical protein
VERHEIIADEDSSNASRVVHSVSNGEETRLYDKSEYLVLNGYVVHSVSNGEETRLYDKSEYLVLNGYLPSKDWWVKKVQNKDDKLLFQEAHNWGQETPELLASLLSKDVEEACSSGKWFKMWSGDVPF